ncbi:MAG: ATP-binding protein [Myxococcota bacterium]
MLKGLTAPQGELSDEALRERVLATVSGILALVGVDADPVQSREHVFLSTIVYRAWSASQNLAIGELIRAILEPPFGQIGVLDVESFYPAKDRQGLAMKLNGLLASPSFAGWLEGEPLDIQRLLYTPDGKPRVSILSIAHLQDAERMFFVTLLLGELVAWMRTQAGTSGLRALLYMDEVMGFLPPVAEPPSKKPLLTLLKQARAFGVGCLLATQNPVDVDYKALSNCGTWFLGRLQTERDVDRVIDGLKGAAQVAGSNLDPKATRATLAGLKSRVFLMNNVHEGAPKLFHTRWALSYLRGPLTRQQIGVLMAEKRAALEAEAASAFNAAATAESEDGNARLNAGAGVDAAAGSHAAPSDGTTQSAASMAPIAPEHIEQIFVPTSAPLSPALVAWVDLHYSKANAGLDHWYHPCFITRLTDGPPRELWATAKAIAADTGYVDEAAEGATFAELPPGALGKARLRSAQSGLKAKCYADQPLILGRCKELKLWSRVDEDRQEFGARYQAALAEHVEARVAKVHEKHRKIIDRIQAKVDKAEEKVRREQAQLDRHKLDTNLSVGTAVASAIFGRGSMAGHARRAASSAKRAQKTAKEREDVAKAQEALVERTAELRAAEAEGNAALAEARAEAPPPVEEVRVAPKKSDIQVTRLALAWVPEDWLA